jgi:tRNA pseudouridine38-40 synthase
VHKRCFALWIGYEGSAFAGFQRQPPFPTVQGALEAALAAAGIHGRLEGASRTDAGVHARKQVVAIRTADPLEAGALPGLLARRLPRELGVLAAREVPWSFHPRHSAVAKVYRYRICTSPAPTPWERTATWTLPDPKGFPDLAGPVTLDGARLGATLAAATGRHDFTALVHPKGIGKRVRLLSRAEVHDRPSPGGGTLYEVTLAAPGFLRHQIRNVVGMAVTAALGRLADDEVARLLAGEGDRWRGARAPGRGLTLWDIGYRRGEDPFRGSAELPPEPGDAPDDGGD